MRRLIAGTLGLNSLLTGTATSGTAVQAGDTMVDARNGLGILDSAYQSDRFANGYLGIWGNTTTTTYEWARILTYTPTSGAVQVGRTFAVTPLSATTPYELFNAGQSPDAIHEALKWACRNAIRPVLWTLTGLLEVNDGSMEASGTTSWTGTNATVTKSTAEATVARYTQSLSVANTGANGYAQSATMPVMEGRNYRVFGLCRTTTGVGSIVVRDLTNAANITTTWTNLSTVDASKQQDWRWLQGSFSTPTGCVNVALQLTNTSATGQSYWDDVGVYPADDGFLDLPTWLVDPQSDIVDVEALVYRFSGRDTMYPTKLRPLRKPVGNPTGTTAWKLPIPPGISFPVSLRAGRALAEFSVDTDTIPAEYQDWIATGAVYRLMVAGTQPRGLDAAEFARERERTRQLWEDQCLTNHPAYRQGRPVWATG